MSEPGADPEVQETSEDSLRSRLEHLEREALAAHQKSERRILVAELKLEAMRAGIVDMDGLDFLDMDRIHMETDGTIVGAAESISQLRSRKPWLFAVQSSSSVAKVPSSRPTRQKLATEMTDEEYKIARANIIRRSAF